MHVTMGRLDEFSELCDCNTVRCGDHHILVHFGNGEARISFSPHAMTTNSSILFQYLDRTTISKLFVPIMGVVLYPSFLFIFFYSGQMLHSNLMQLNELICQSEWYRYPSTVQRSIVMMMRRAQQPFYLSVYGVVTLRLDNYVKVGCVQSPDYTFNSRFICDWIL